MTDTELAHALREVALLEGDFTLRSGRKSKYYFDKYLFETQPALLQQIGERLAKHATDDVDRIAGPELGAVALAAVTSLVSGKPFVIVRNSKKADYGTGKLIEGKLEPGEKVLLVEDIVTSGGQAVEAIKTLKAAGAEVVRAAVVIDRQEDGMDNLRAVAPEAHALFTSADLGM